MACETYRMTPQQTEAQRQAEVKQKLKALEDQLRTKSVRLGISPNGAIVFKGWADRGGVTDACAFRRLTSQGSFELRRAVIAAEAEGGRKVNMNAVNSGEHSHDGGKTFGPGHDH